ncbi:MAG: sulfite exporter TauE/SafE family protein [Alphaproteobacteria bacterium]|nr:sulfite exporter TauE/SafE family protein [Alphaproteobacteria bacterium]
MEPVLGALDPLTILAGAVVCFAAAGLGGVAGMGSGMIVTLFITPIIGAKAVVPVISVLMLINNASRVWFYRDALVPSRIALIAGVAIPMSYLGAQIYVRLDGALIQAMLGAILISSIPLRRWMAGRKMAPSTGQVVAVSGLFGLLSSLIVGAGMLVIPMLMGFGLVGPALLATDAAIAVLVNLAKVAFFGSLDALSMPMFLLALAMGACTIPGTWAGAWVVRRTSVRIHTVFIEALIMVGGASLIWGGLVA